MSETTPEISPIRQMINYAREQKYSKISPIFKQQVNARIVDRIEGRRAEIGANMFVARDGEN